MEFKIEKDIPLPPNEGLNAEAHHCASSKVADRSPLQMASSALKSLQQIFCASFLLGKTHR